MNKNEFFKLATIALLLITIVSCRNPLVDKAIEENNRFLGADGWVNDIDNNIHQYKLTHDTTLLYGSLACLDSVRITDDNTISWHTRRLSVLRLLHQYDTVYALLDTWSDEAVGDFGKTNELIVTEISQHNYLQQFVERDQKIDQLVAYLEYCFERQQSTVANDEQGYLQKYKDNPLALQAVATEVNEYTLNWYIGVRLLRGDDKTDMKALIDNYYQQGNIDQLGKSWLESLLEGDYEEKDIDANL